MTACRQRLVDRIYRGADPFHAFPPGVYATDLQGWHSDHVWLKHIATRTSPSVVVEIGVWKGASVVTMAAAMRAARIDGVVVAVDTWLGSPEHWLNPEWFASLGLMHGRPTLQAKFMSNVLAAGLVEYVLPLPLDSLSAARLLGTLGIRPTAIHLDAAHEYEPVAADLRAWWPLLAEQGAFLGDDYNIDGHWPGVKRAFDDFFGQAGMPTLKYHAEKCLIESDRPLVKSSEVGAPA